jgi:hypothetical protein
MQESKIIVICIVCIFFYSFQNNISPVEMGVFVMTWAESILMQDGLIYTVAFLVALRTAW